MRMDRSAFALPLLAGLSGYRSRAPRQPDRLMTQGQRRQVAGGCATAAAVASVIFTFMRTVRLSFAPRIA
ncbi:hypothetical protein XarbCFBP7604_07695 [Xanthomonas arboricola]|uniref:hypothetical protein n=1 Tax=Xanthomonas arboricola TaxID=56448 RepID=UPI000CEED816|nr:hypothetical protein [Xanthomonas arboricola]PPU33776.1 hypothetical protein XarbCFBP7604_07695 [Xanthomonas arboricola]